MTEPKTPEQLRDLAVKARKLARMSHDAVIGAALLATAEAYEREADELERARSALH